MCIGGNCQCDEGYVNEGKACVDICDGINCGTGGICAQGICNCGEGYVKIENVCEETCALNPCKELIKIRHL